MRNVIHDFYIRTKLGNKHEALGTYRPRKTSIGLQSLFLR